MRLDGQNLQLVFVSAYLVWHRQSDGEVAPRHSPIHGTHPNSGGVAVHLAITPIKHPTARSNRRHDAPWSARHPKWLRSRYGHTVGCSESRGFPESGTARNGCGHNSAGIVPCWEYGLLAPLGLTERDNDTAQPFGLWSLGVSTEA